MSDALTVVGERDGGCEVGHTARVGRGRAAAEARPYEKKAGREARPNRSRSAGTQALLW